MEKLNFHRDLIESCKKGDRNAQFNLYQKYSKAMYNICLRMLNDNGTAEDILQESFVQVFSKIDTYEYRSTPGAWIKRIVVNNCISHLRKRKVEFEEVTDYMNVPAETPTVVDTNSWTVRKIKTAMTQLSDGYRNVFSLYALEGYDHQEIADICGISESTSKSQYSRAKQKIREIMMNS